MGSNEVLLGLIEHLRDAMESEPATKKVEPDKPKYKLENDTKWLLDDDGNYTGLGVEPNGQLVDDLVYRAPKDNLYEQI